MRPEPGKRNDENSMQEQKRKEPHDDICTISMNHIFPSPLDIVESPELAVLAALDAALQAASFALMAEYPNLKGFEPFYENTDIVPIECIADSAITLATGLRGTLAAYRSVLVRNKTAIHQSQSPLCKNDFPF